MLSIQTILHPTDLSKSSDAALQVAASIAGRWHARLIVLHILSGAEPPEWIYERMAGEFPWTQDCEKVLEERIRQLQQEFPGIKVERQIREGSPAEEILRIAAAERCDMIVMGTHGRTGQDRTLMGSVAEEVTRKTRCPVLTMKLPLPSDSQRSTEKHENLAEVFGTE